MVDFSERLKELREERRLSQRELASKIGVSDIAVSRWEKKLRIPNIEAVVSLAKFFGVTVGYMAGVEN